MGGVSGIQLNRSLEEIKKSIQFIVDVEDACSWGAFGAPGWQG